MSEFCHSCAASLGMPDFKGPNENFCKYCTDSAGKLKPRAEVQAGIAHWFQTWQPNLDELKAAERAAHYMKSMPAWGE